VDITVTDVVVTGAAVAEADAVARPGEGVNLAEELKEELAAAEIPPQAAAQTDHAVPKMTADAKEELTAADHHDLGMAYMGMGLVDQAVKELTLANKGDPSPAVKKVKRAAKKAVAAVKKVAVKARAAVKKAAAKRPAAKAPAARAPAAKAPKRGAKVKVAAKKTAKQVGAKAKAAIAKGKAKASATKLKVQARVAVKKAAKKAALKRPAAKKTRR
jgi:valyl-tRNA synthetase